MVLQDPHTERKRSAREIDGHLLLALSLSLVAALPLLVGPGIVNTRAGGDSPFLLQRVHQLAANLRSGTFPARWMPDGAHGLGYPAFNFYAALPYYVAALLDWAGLGILWGTKLTQMLGFLLAGAGMYVLSRRIGAGRDAALLASCAYTFAPFHMVNVYVRGDSLSEFFAMALYPLIVWALLKVRERPTAEHVALLAASYAALVLSHNISALIFTPLLCLWLAFEAISQRKSSAVRTLICGLAGLGLGLALATWYWVPALRERHLVQLGEQTTGYFHYEGHFLGSDLVQWRLLHDYSVGGPSGGNPFSTGLVQGLLALLGLGALVARLLRRERLRVSHFAAAGCLLGYTWLMTPSSRWVWENVPLLANVQFPWRLLTVQALGGALVVMNIPALLPGRLSRGLALFLAALTTVAGLSGISPDRLPLAEGDVTPARLMLYETYSGNIGSTVRYEYLPREMVPRPHTSAVQLNGGEKAAPLALEGRLVASRLVRRTAHAETWEIEVSEPTLLAFHTTYYPGWEATVDGVDQGVEPLVGLGLVGIRLDPGAHRVVLRFEDTPTRRWASWTSAGGLLFWLALGLYPCLRSGRYRRTTALIACALIAFVAYLALARGWFGASTGDVPPQTDGPLVMDFARAPYLHNEPDGVLFGEAQLLNYTLSTSRLEAGDELSMAMDWRAPCPGSQVIVRLMGATAHLYEPSPVWCEKAAALDRRRVQLELRLPEDIPPGLCVLRVDVEKDGEREVVSTPEGRGLAKLALEPVQVVAGRRATGEERVLGDFGPERAPRVIALVDASVSPADDGTLEVALTWRSERQAPLNYYMSLRLNRGDGSRIVSRDLPPLLGGYPTSLWRPGELVADRVLLPLPNDESIAEDCELEIVLYDRMTLKAVGTAALKGIQRS